ncbi:MAG TPA: hypothetical protein V6C72_18225, partial [Chroococcales cyanobacterium]
MTDSESRQQQQSSNNAGHDLLGHLHDYHSSSPTFEYSYFTGEQAQLSIPVIPGIPVTEQAPVPQLAPAAPIAPVAQLAPALQVPPVPQLAPAPAAQAPEPAPQWSESSEKDRWIAFAQHEQTRIRDEKRTQEAERERQACHSGMQFSAGFNFHESLAKIFWRTDCDRSNRLDQAELTRALSERW